MTTTLKRAIMNLVKVTRSFQITLPKNIREQSEITNGDLLEVEYKEGEIVIRPVKVVNRDQAYFWTKRWQKGEAEADADIAEGRVAGPFETVDDLANDLKS